MNPHVLLFILLFAHVKLNPGKQSLLFLMSHTHLTILIKFNKLIDFLVGHTLTN